MNDKQIFWLGQAHAWLNLVEIAADQGNAVDVRIRLRFFNDCLTEVF